MRPTLAFAVLAAVLSFGSSAHAQLTGLNHVWTVPGVMNTVDGLGTFIACTNGNTTPAQVGVEFYGLGGNFLGASPVNVTLAPGQSALFGTTGATGISVGYVVAVGLVTTGHARVMASTSRGILCSAFLADSNDAIPATMVSLSVVKKTAQKGD